MRVLSGIHSRLSVARRRAAVVTLAITVLAAAWPVSAQRRLTPRSVQDRLARLGEMAQQGHWQEVGPEAQGLLQELRGTLVSGGEVGDDSSQLAATVLSLLALAESAQDRRDEALWHWSVAQSLWPDLARSSLSAYGEPAALLREHRIDPEKHRCSGPEGCDEDDEERILALGEQLGPGYELQPPVKLEAPAPRYPPGARTRRLEGDVLVKTIIDKDGHMRQPILLDYPSVALALAAVEALRHWRFEPARLNGRPIDVYYNLRVNFYLR